MPVDNRERVGARYLRNISELSDEVTPKVEAAARRVAGEFIRHLQSATGPVEQGDLNLLRMMWGEQLPRLSAELVQVYDAGFTAAFGKEPSPEHREAFAARMLGPLSAIADTLVNDATEAARIGGREAVIEALREE